MSDTPRTDDAQFGTGRVSVDFARQLERELTAAQAENTRLHADVIDLWGRLREKLEAVNAAQAEIARLKAGGCARDQRTTQFCGEAVKLQEENARLQERVKRLEEALSANRVFHTPIALRRRGGEWDEYELDAIRRTREEIGAT